jgi:glycosyltransferase involved in cell wall biosynthesis
MTTVISPPKNDQNRHMRILILAHGHPELSPGGGERAAYALFQRLRSHPDVAKAVFVARAEHQSIGHDAFFGSFRGRPDEILVAPPPVDGFTFQTLGYDVLKKLVDNLVGAIRPDVVHIHHFIFWGIEIFELFKQAGVRVVFTLHEYAAICAHYGQMVKSDGRLCYAASPAECSMCLPSMSAGKFFVRNTILKHLLASVDGFIAPSAFLKDRYEAWGIPAERLTVVENLLDEKLTARRPATEDPDPPLPPALSEVGEATTVFGYFAQINPFKGYDVLLEAAALLPDDVRRRATIRIHGENRHYRTTEFHERTQALLAEVRDVVSPMGLYRGDNVIALMSACDWIVVPSIWWENSPIVMQEARLAGRPLICADIGGMAEKADPRVDHLVPARSPGALSALMSRIVRSEAQSDRTRLNGLAQARAQADEIHFARHWALYQTMIHAPEPSSD